MTENRIHAMEERIAHLEKMLEELSDVAHRQDGEIARLTRRLKTIIEREAEREADQGGTVPLADWKPPHW